MHCTCLFVESCEQIACQDWIKVAGTHGDCTDVVEMAQQEAEVRPMLAIDPTCPHGLHYLADARGLCKMILVVANITVEVPGQSALEQLKTLRVPILYGLLAKERRVGERVAAIMQQQCRSRAVSLHSPEGVTATTALQQALVQSVPTGFSSPLQPCLPGVRPTGGCLAGFVLVAPCAWPLG